METIVRIEETKVSRDEIGFLAIQVTTSKQVIILAIENTERCCEIFGMYVCTETETNIEKINEEFKDAVFEKVGFVSKISNQKLAKILHDEPKMYCDKDMQYAIIEIKTSKGNFQLLSYNQHNGYYPHDILIEWGGFSEIQSL